MRSFALLAVIAVASAEDATAHDDMLDDYVSMMIRQASSDEGADAESDLDEAIQAKHGHGPHGHGPHGHWPHRHSPHGHNPHGHNPHRHNPHVHTPYPTPNPTPHPCDDGSHGCDTADGICYKAGGNSWTCGCKVDHHCIAGCSAPHTGHNCVVITPQPTAYPTTQPTRYPTPNPTTYPTSMPTSSPTTAPTFIGIDEIDAVKKCCEKVIGIDVNYIMPLHTCADVRAGSREDLRKGLHNLEVTKGLDNDDVFDWLHKNRCFHERHDTLFPTPSPTAVPTAAPTSYSGAHETMLHLRSSDSSVWGKIGLPEADDHLHLSASNCVQRSNLEGTFGSKNLQAKSNRCAIDTSAKLISAAKLVYESAGFVAQISLYSDGTLRFESPTGSTFKVEQGVSFADLTGADCLTQINFGKPETPGGHICMASDSTVYIRSNGVLTL